MKTKVKRLSKRSLAMLMSFLILTTCLIVGQITAYAGWTWETTWYVNNSISSVWGNNNSSPVATRNNGILTYIYYLKKNDTAFDMAFYCSGWGNDGRVIPSDDAQSKALTTSNQNCKQGYNGTNGSWKVDPSKLTNSNQYYKYTITCDLSQNNYWGAMKYSATALTNLSPTLTAPSTGTVGSAISLSGSSTDTGKVGTLTKTYQYSTNNGSTWNDLTSGSYTPTAAGTVKFRYKVSDSGVVASGASTAINARTARVEYSDEKSCTVSAAATTYNNITVDAKGSTDGSTYNTTLSGTPATISANSYTTGTSALTITAGTVSGYTFAQWKVTAGSGTIGSTTSASTTFTPSASNTTVTAQYKKNYTFSNGTTDTHGTVTVPSGTKYAGDSYSGTVTPADGYKIKTLTVGGNAVSAAVGKTSAYTYSGTTGSSTTGTTTPISVVATFEPITNLQLYIAGRFRVRPSAGSSSWTTTYASGSDWNATSTNIPFTYLSGTTYKVDTYASLKELSAKPTNNQDPWFFVYDKTNSKAWHPTTQNRELGTTTEYNLTTNTDTYNVRFNSSSDDSPVTIYFDYNTKRLWYSVPDLYDVTVGTATGGSVTASPTRAESGTTVTLTIAPSTGYQLSSITAKDASNATVTLSGSGNSRTFTMPAKNVTVTPAFSKITWSGLTAVGKYSTTGASGSYTNTWSSGGPNVTIASTSATQLDGVAVTAPATDPTGYVFAGWITNNGSFANAANKDTIFKPNAANAQAVATYKKIYTITSSVDNTGTGAGAAPTISITSGAVAGQTNKLVAGGSYSVTASPVSASGVESIKVNSTNKGSNTSYTISSVSADQTVVVKYKSKVYLKGTMNSTAWAGDVMQANSAGTTYTKSEVTLNAGTTYEFKHWVDSGGDGTYSVTVDTWTLNNIATHSTKSDGYGGTNLTITPSVKAKVTFVSNGSKFTSITAIPYDSTQYNVTLTQSADYTITATYMGVEYTTSGKNANVTVPVYSGTGFSYTVTPASGKYLSAVAQSDSVALSPAFAVATHANSYSGTVSSVSKAFTVSATAANKFTITAKSNKSKLGTVSVSPSSARPGETVTVTINENNGTISTLSYTYTSTSGDSTTTAINLNSSPAKKTAETFSSLLASDRKSAKLLTSAGYAKLTTGASTKTFKVPDDVNSAITLNATFTPYTAESTWYYNGYDTSGNKVTSHWGKQMTEGKVGGEKFSYYHVEDRTGDDHLFTVSNGRVADTRYVYFTRPKNFSYWNQSNSPKAHFWKNGGSDYDTWPGNTMTWVYDNDMGEAVFKIAIPVGADRVSFNDASNSGTQQTVDIDLTTTSGAYYVSGWNDSAQKYNYGTWNTSYSDQGYVVSGTEYFYDSERYTNDYSTKGFYNHNVSNVNNFTKPKDLGSNKGDYYVNVLYAGKTYTINGVTKTVGAKDLVIWSTEPLAGDDETTTIYAKDGSIRSETYGSTYANIADTKIYAADGTTTVGTKHNGNITNQTYETYKAAKGDTIVIKTQIGATDSGTLTDATTLKAKYYVRGFCVNGEVSQLLEWNANGLYTLTYKVPEDEDISKIEITPIYYLKDTEANPIVTYRVTGFTDELKAVGSGKPGWGDTLYTYPYYGKLGSNNNALGAYPGQPMVYYKGQYQMQIPQKSTAWDIYLSDAALSGTDAQKKTQVANTAVSGVTMSNGYYDIVHRQIMGYGSNGTSADHVQTYDYGDFYKIFNEKKPVDNIVFDFKYETKKHNFENQPATSVTKSTLDTNYGTNGNGFELLTNFHGRHVDLFGTALSGDAADPSKTTPVYVVSIGGVNGSAGVENIAGYYATEWMVYGSSNGTNYTRITAGNKNSIPPEVLVLNDDDNTSFNTTTYPSADANHTVNDWKALYTALEAYRGKPVMISYEAADAQIGSGNYATSGGGGATRNDGRWLYSKNGETITSKIRVDVSENNGATYTPNDELVTPVENLDAFFTNDEADGETTFTTTIDPDKTFDFEAHSNNENYKFMGWYMDDGTKITSDNISHTERSGSYTFVARFMHFTGGQLILGHKAATDTTYKGVGTATIAVTVKDANDEIVREIEASSSDITLDDKIINNENVGYTIEVTLNATGTGEDTYARTTCSAANKFFGGQSSYSSMPQTFSFTVGDLFSGNTQNVKKITYSSYFTQVAYSYDVTFKFTGRLTKSNGDRVSNSFRKQGTLTAKQIASYVTGSGENKYIKPEFLTSIAPYEENYGEDLVWDFSGVDNTRRKFTYTSGANSYKLTVDVNGAYEATQSENPKELTVTFDLPFAHDSYGKANNVDSMTKDSTQENFPVTVNYGQVAKIDPEHGHSTAGATEYDYTYVTAPKVLVDNDVNKYFQYWDVQDKNGKTVTKCYMNRFNFVAYDNYTVIPVYGSAAYEADNDDSISTSISFLDTTRNQWNNNGNGDASGITNSDAQKASDLLFNDFLLSFSYKGKELNSANLDGVNTGFVVQRLGTLEKYGGDDNTRNTDADYYKEKYKDQDDSANVRACINGSTVSGFDNISIANNQLDNKDRVQWYYSVFNSRGWDDTTDKAKTKYTYLRYVYRAYSYIKDSNGITLSDPVYFTMYDKAVK